MARWECCQQTRHFYIRWVMCCDRPFDHHLFHFCTAPVLLNSEPQCTKGELSQKLLCSSNYPSPCLIYAVPQPHLVPPPPSPQTTRPLGMICPTITVMSSPSPPPSPPPKVHLPSHCCWHFLHMVPPLTSFRR